MATPFERTLRDLARQTSRAAWWAWSLGALLAGLWAAWFTLAQVNVVEVSRRARLEVRQAPHAVMAAAAGQVADSALQIGREVRAGDRLLGLDSRGLLARRDEALAALASVPARRVALQAEAAALQAALPAQAEAGRAARRGADARVAEAAAQAGFADEHAARLAADAAEGGAAPIEALRLQAEAQRLAAAREALAAEPRRLASENMAQAQQGRARLAQLQGAIAALQGETRLAQATVARLDGEIERLVVRAPVDGVLAEVQPLAPGSHVAEGQRLATVVPRGPMMLVAEFAPETALGRLRPGQTARWRLDGFPWTQYGTAAAQVVRVAGEVREQTVRAELALPPDVSLPLQHGLAGTVEVTLEQVSPARLLWRAIGQALPVSP